jgi:thiosulfate/3-mercaptopyruvate sulfurtransferase
VQGNPKAYAHPELLITAQDLDVALRSPTPPLVIDVRPAEQFARGQIPGAVHLDLWGVSLIDTDPAPLRAFLWMIHHQFAQRGVQVERPVVLCDEHSGLRAARAFWFLECFRHPDVRVLDGGFAGWLRAGGDVDHDPVAPVASTWIEAEDLSRLATWRDVLAGMGDPATVILDTRTDGEYMGTVVRATRGGAVPGAIHIEWTHNLDADGLFKSAADLRLMYEAAGLAPDRRVLTYCQGGYRAAHSYLALRLLGYPDVRTYLGSWKEWGDRDDLPIEVPRTQV